MTALSYYKKVFSRACDDTARAFGWSVWTLLLAVSLLFVGFFVYRYVSGPEQALGEITVWVCTVAVPIVAVASVTFAYNLLCAPWRLHRHNEQAIQGLQQQVETLCSGSGLPQLRLEHDPKEEACNQLSYATRMLKVKVTCSDPSVPLRNLSVHLVSISALKNKTAISPLITDVKGPLMVSGEMEKPPRQAVHASPGQTVYFDVIKQFVDPQRNPWAMDSLFICHAKGVRRKRQGEEKNGIMDGYCRVPSDQIPSSNYRLILEATADNALACRAQFKASIARNGALKFQLERILAPQGGSGVLRIVFDEATCVQRNSNGTLLYRIQLRNDSKDGPLENCRVSLGNIKAKGQDAKRRRDPASRLRGVPLLLMHDPALRDPNSAPTKEFTLNAGEGRFVDVIQEAHTTDGVVEGYFDVVHCKQLIWRERAPKREPESFIEAGAYELTIEASSVGAHATETFLIGQSKGRLTFRRKYQ